jgi:hypothetical protein
MGIGSHHPRASDALSGPLVDASHERGEAESVQAGADSLLGRRKTRFHGERDTEAKGGGVMTKTTRGKQKNNSGVVSVEYNLGVVFPMPPNIANAYMHHMVKHKIRQGYYAICDVLIRGVLGRDENKDLERLAKYAQKGNTPLRRDCQRLVATLQDAGNWPKVAPPAKPLPRALIASRMTLGARMDTGNAMNRHKWVEDWLVTRGYVENDNEDCLQWSGFPEQTVDRSSPYRIHITLTTAA